MSRPKILVARANFPEVITKLEQHFDVESNQADVLWTKAELIQKLQGKVGLFCTSGEPMDAEVIAAADEHDAAMIFTGMPLASAEIAVPATLASISTYILREQEDWFEDEIRFVRRWLHGWAGPRSSRIPGRFSSASLPRPTRTARISPR